MKYVGEQLAAMGWTLRSGGAEGADTAFEQGCDAGNGAKEIFLPWRGFNHSTSQLSLKEPVDAKLFDLAAQYHPAWGRLSRSVRLLIARDGQQVLGANLDKPSTFIVCWTENGKATGGTGQAIRIAEAFSIPVFNFKVDDAERRLTDFLKGLNEIMKENGD